MSTLGKAILATLVGGFLILSVAPKAQAHPWWADSDDGYRYRYSRDWDDDDGWRYRQYRHHEPDADDFALLCDSDRDDCRPNPAYEGYRSNTYRPYYNPYQYREYRTSPWSFFTW
jgi:hypothetical protein